MDFLPELSGVDASRNLVLALSLPSPLPSEGVVVGAVLWLALAKADPNVAFELDGVAVRELESVKNGREVSPLSVILPFLEDIRVCGAAVVVSHSVDGLVVVVVHGPGNAVASKASVDFSG